MYGGFTRETVRRAAVSTVVEDREIVAPKLVVIRNNFGVNIFNHCKLSAGAAPAE